MRYRCDLKFFSYCFIFLVVEMPVASSSYKFHLSSCDTAFCPEFITEGGSIARIL